jgi:hypothetical protein
LRGAAEEGGEESAEGEGERSAKDSRVTDEDEEQIERGMDGVRLYDS